MITLSEQDILALVGIIGTFIGVAIAIWQSLRVRKLRKLYEEKCSTRCKDIYDLISHLSNQVTIACKEVKSDEFVREAESNINLVRHVNILTAKVDSIMTLTWQLIRFCERLNEEHQQEFGKPAIEDLSSKLRRLVCIEYIPFGLVELPHPGDSTMEQSKCNSTS